MRLLHVSAHYPPNFVSGGTLVPQRLARELRRRDHDVHVYAGYLDEARPSLSTWSDVDETGLPVRWIVTTPWLGWGDTRNFDNPAVAADFAQHVAAVRPDVVHLHALQSLGAGLLEVAAAAGASVVVTMHDFWWCCARQFLVDRTMTPCCLVVDAGCCGCEVDRPWLDRRQDFLRAALAYADLVLAPSGSAADVLVANGLSSGRVHVDENGLPEADVAYAAARQRQPTGVLAAGARAPSSAAQPVRFLYAGGSNPMKGVAVLVRAVHRLAGRPGWSLSAYGVQEYLDREAVEVKGLPVRVFASYDPDRLEEVLAGHDVLVIPSLMRESYSILTREALSRGLAVICTDSLGPEEVVRHGRNGLVVATGDARDLAEAMGRVADDRTLLAALTGAPPEAGIRRLDEQVDGLEALYGKLLHPRRDRSQRPDSRAAAVNKVLFVCGIEGAPLRYRARLPAEALATQGVASDVRHYRDPELPMLADAADAVVFYRVPATVQVLDLIARIRCRSARVPVLFDVDDLIFDPELEHTIPAIKILPPPEAELWMEGVRRYRTTLEACDLFVGSTAPLCRHVEEVTGLPARRFANGVGMLMGRLADAALRRPRADGPVRLGYLSGTTTHDRDWWEVEPAVVEVMARHPATELWLGGHLMPSHVLDPVADRVRRLPILPWYELPGVLRDLDVNLAPLESVGLFNEAKSAIKWLEAALAGTPTVASPTEPFQEAVNPGVNGMLAAKHEEWVAALDLLIADEATRHRLGNRARRDALLRWSPYLQGERYLAILEEATSEVAALAAAPVARASRWEPVALNEPFMPTALEPYELPVTNDGHRVGSGDAPQPAPLPMPPGRGRRLSEVAHRYRARARVLWRDGGLPGIAAGAGRLARRMVGRIGRGARQSGRTGRSAGGGRSVQ